MATTRQASFAYAVVTISNMSVDNIAGVTVGANGIAPGTSVSVSTDGNSIVLTWDGTATYTDGEAADFSVDNTSTCLATSGIMRTWTVTDGCNNSSTAVQYFTIVDTQGPEFTSTPANLELSCNDEIPSATIEALEIFDLQGRLVYDLKGNPKLVSEVSKEKVRLI